MRILLFGLSIFFFACAGTTGRIQFYNFSTSKYQVNKELLAIINENSIYKVPLKWKSEAISYDFLEREYIYFANGPEEMYEIGFSGDSTDWNRLANCKLALIGVFKGKEWKFEKDLSSDEKKRLESRFETEVLSKLRYNYYKSN